MGDFVELFCEFLTTNFLGPSVVIELLTKSVIALSSALPRQFKDFDFP